MIAARKSEQTITVVPGSELSNYPITLWDIRVIIILWVLFFLTLIFVILRFYSRIRILQFYALEDHLYNVAFVSCKKDFYIMDFWCMNCSICHACRDSRTDESNRLADGTKTRPYGTDDHGAGASFLTTILPIFLPAYLPTYQPANLPTYPTMTDISNIFLV